MEKILKADPDIDHWTFYIGSGAIRFYLPLDAQLANDFFAQAVVVTKGYASIARPCRSALRRRWPTDFDTILTRVSPLELGPPGGLALKFRVSGRDRDQGARRSRMNFAQLIGQNPSPQHQLRLERNVQE